jgi:hypothetical protein
VKKVDLTQQRFGRLTILFKNGKNTAGRILWECKCECGNVLTCNTTELLSGRKTRCGHDCILDIKNICGRRFHYLKVLEYDRKNKDGRRLWKCQCDCGKTQSVVEKNLLNGTAHSCGCYRLERLRKVKLQDISGQKFGRLTALNRVNKSNRSQWKCKCDCGKITYPSLSALKRGSVKSCGCYSRDTVSIRLSSNLIGQRFGRLVVQGKVGYKYSYLLWKCKCDCGKCVELSTNVLRMGNTQSCGCYANELSRMRVQQNDFKARIRMSNQVRAMEKQKNEI